MYTRFQKYHKTYLFEMFVNPFSKCLLLNSISLIYIYNENNRQKLIIYIHLYLHTHMTTNFFTYIYMYIYILQYDKKL